MAMPDAIKSMLMLMDAPRESLTTHGVQRGGVRHHRGRVPRARL
jgi:hypothetical protein